MGQVSAVLRKVANGYAHWCPGCEEMHYIAVESPQPNGAKWSFNGDVDRPTFSPSVRIASGHFATGKPPGNCWCDLKDRLGEESSFECGICHYFITAGEIRFCADSTHALAGRCVPLPPLPAHVSD